MVAPRFFPQRRRDVHLLLNLDPEQFAAHNRAQARGIDQPDQGDEERWGRKGPQLRVINLGKL